MYELPGFVQLLPDYNIKRPPLPSKIAFKVVFLSQPRRRRPRSRRPTGVFLSKNGFTKLVVLYLSLHSRPTKSDQGFEFRERRWIGTFSEFYAYKRRQTFKMPAHLDFLKIAYFLLYPLYSS